MKGKLALIVDGLVGDQSDLFPTLRLHPKGKKKANARWLMLFPYTRHYFFSGFLPALEPEPGGNEKKEQQQGNPPIHPSILRPPIDVGYLESCVCCVYLPLEQWNFF